MVIENLISDLLVNLTLIGNVLIGLFIITLIAARYGKWEDGNKMINYLNKNALLFAFIVSLIAVSGSLFYSEIRGFEPCFLCWIQRIFMYPLPIILGIALWHKDHAIKKYVLPLSVIGALIAVYHYSTQVFEKISTCGIDSGVSCTIRYTFGYGYITIPVMALTAFIIIAVLMTVWKRESFK
ncbi:MAG: disulfide oxidoreductase [Candidatus Pacearchaeota archaeon]